MPNSRAWATASVVNGKCYVIGGGSGEGGFFPPALATVDEYDPDTTSWRGRASLPAGEGRSAAASAVVDGKIYVLGGGERGCFGSEADAAVAI